MAGAVDLAAQDKVGRYEVPRGDVATLKKIANPLKLGVMHEQAFVLLHEWPDLINRRAAGHPQVTVAEIRNWIKDRQPGLPALVQNLVIVCYSIQANKEWLRGGRPVPAPAKVEAVTDDLALRSQELPADAEFDEASRRAQGIFQVPREPVRSARSVQATAQILWDKAGGLRSAAESLQDELKQHAATLGLAEDSPRMATSRIVTTLLAQLAAADGATRTLRVLAGAELDKDNAIYAAHLAAAGELAAVLRGLTWQLLDDFAAGDDDQDAAAILAELRQAARHEELEVSLAGPLREAERAALELVRTRTRKPLRIDRPSRQEPGPRLDHAIGQRPGAEPGPQWPDSSPGTRVHARDVAGLVKTICEAADANPEAEFEISWRIVT